MSDMTDKATGKVKEAVGSATGDDSMKTKGQAQQTKGDIETTANDVKSTVQNVADRAKSDTDDNS